MRTGTRFRAAAGALCLIAAGQSEAQGVPVFDGTNFAKTVEQLQEQLKDAETQFQQLEQLKAQVQTELQQLTNIKGMLASITGINQLYQLYNTAEDIRSRASKITDFSGFIGSVASGNFNLKSFMLDGQVTMGGKMAGQYVQDQLKAAGFTPEVMQGLATSTNPKAPLIASSAAANVTGMATAQASYEESQQAMQRIDGLVQEIGQTQTLKESVDLNTRMAAETNYMLGEMWRLNAAQGLTASQDGLDWAAEKAREASFFNFNISSGN